MWICLRPVSCVTVCASATLHMLLLSIVHFPLPHFHFTLLLLIHPVLEKIESDSPQIRLYPPLP